MLSKGKFNVPVDRAAVRDDWRRRGYSCDLFTDPPGRQWNDFVHDTDELITVVDGRMRVIVAGESYVAEPGDEVYIPRGALHSVHNLHAGTTRWLYGYD
jgi:quercetin dioxygenase-like cupin family protein